MKIRFLDMSTREKRIVMEAVERRVKTCRMICSMLKFPDCSKNLGLNDQSKFRGKAMTKREEKKDG